MNVKNWLGTDNKLGIDIWEKKYRYNNESFEEWLDRVSGGDQDLRNMIVNKEFIFGGRILSNRGLQHDGKKITMSNCYVITPPEDSIESIFDTAKSLARTFSYGGGCGIDISKLRPRGSKVNNTAKHTSGAVSFMDLYSLTTEIIGQNGRRGALMISIDVEHPDVEEFIKVKSDLSRITKANISIRVNKRFMKAVQENRKYMHDYIVESNGEIITHEIDAPKLWKELCYQNWNYAEPGILFWDHIEKWNLLSEDNRFKYAGTNPCLTGDTLIQTVEGLIPIKDLVGSQPYVYCMDNENGGKLTIRQASKVWKTKENAEIVEVITGKGSIKCTPDHKIFTTNRGWVEAQYLVKGDKIKGLNRQTTGHKYCSVGLSGEKYVKEHRFVASHFLDINGKDVHHKNYDGFDNRLSNLEVINHSEHSKISNTGRVIDYNRDLETGRFLEKDNKTKRVNNNLGKKSGLNWYVTEVRKLDYKEDVYDITVPDVHNFVANDMVVHNCAEEPLPAGGSCLLGSIVLPTFVKDGKFDFVRFEEVVSNSVKALNDVLDEGLPLHPLQEQRDSVRDWRQIGLGVLGVGDMLIKLGLVYGSDESLSFCNKLSKLLIDTALLESSKLAKEFGVYPKYNDPSIMRSPFLIENASIKTINHIQQYGLRNSQLLTIAPTGSIGTMLEISTGIEPNFAFSYERKTESLHGEDKTYKVFAKIAKDFMEQHNIKDEKDLPNYFVTAQNLNPENRIKMQSVWQKRIDASISSTVNLVKGTTVEDVSKLYLLAYDMGLKGMTIYRSGCAREGILTVDSKSETTNNNQGSKVETIKRGEMVKVPSDTIYIPKDMYHGCGKAKVMIGFSPSQNKCVDVYYINKGKGGCSKNTQGEAILISQILRIGGDLKDVQKSFAGIDACSSCTMSRMKGKRVDGINCPNILLNLVINTEKECKQLISDIQNISDNKIESTIDTVIENTKIVCPSCQAELEVSGGCYTCRHCGYSKCD